MHRESLVALAIILAANISLGQQDVTASSSKLVDTAPAASPVYFVGPNVTSPELIPSNPLPVFTDKCKKQDDSVDFTLVVGTAGYPHRVTYARGPVTEVSQMARQIVEADRFIPGTRDGKPAAVEISLTVNIQGCIDRVKDASGQKTDEFHLRAQPTQKVEAIPDPGESVPALTLQESTESDGTQTYKIGGVSPPVPLTQPAAEYTTAARRARIEGICLISIIVDANGVPQNSKVIRSLDPGLDQNALKAVSKYRFKPAMKGNQPVPVQVTIEVNFRLYK